MKKVWIGVLAALLLCLPFPVLAQADTSAILSEQYDAAGADELPNHLPDGVEGALDKAGVDSPAPEDVQQFSLGGFFAGLLSQAADIAKAPLGILAGCFAVMLLCALFGAFSSASSAPMAGVLGTVSTLAVCGVLLAPLVECVQMAASAIRTFGDFMLCFIPVYTGVIATSGCPTAALGYNTALFAVAELISSITTSLLLPFIGIFMALSVAGSVSGQFKISGLTATVKKTVVFSLTFLVTLFVGLFSMQSMVSVSADGLGIKTAKFLSGSFVPVVGSAMSDALSSVIGCLGVIKSSVGGYGVLVCLLTFLPPILTVLFYLFAVQLAGGAAEFLGVGNVNGLMAAVKDALSILLAFLLCIGVITIVTTTLMLTMSGGG